MFYGVSPRIDTTQRWPQGVDGMEADAPLDEAVKLGDRYVLGGLIGRGGMAEVYRAHDRVLGRTVAVKVMRAVAAGDEDRARFADEARMLAQLSHPGLVTVLDAATCEDEPYLVMELVDGPSLADLCRGSALDPQRVATIGAQLADALGHVHAAGIVHRDLKPANVLLGSDGRAQLTDFGLARILAAVMRHTTSGAMVGTPAYLAPEQLRAAEITPAADVYALGLVLIEALSGAVPYQGSPIEAALARLTTPPPIPDRLPRRWHLLLRAMTALDPADRPTTAEVGATLRELAAGGGTAAQAVRRAVVNRWHVAVGVTLGVLLVVPAALWYGGADPWPSPATPAPQVPGGDVDDLRALERGAPGRAARDVAGVVRGPSRRGPRAGALVGVARIEGAQTRTAAPTTMDDAQDPFTGFAAGVAAGTSSAAEPAAGTTADPAPDPAGDTSTPSGSTDADDVADEDDDTTTPDGPGNNGIGHAYGLTNDKQNNGNGAANASANGVANGNGTAQGDAGG